MRKICWSPGLCPGPRWGSLQRSPRPPSWWGWGLCSLFDNAAPSSRTPLTILSLCLSCVYVHTCMKMYCYFLLNVKHGASQLYWGGGSNYLAPALGSLTDKRVLDHYGHHEAMPMCLSASQNDRTGGVASRRCYAPKRKQDCITTQNAINPCFWIWAKERFRFCLC